MQQVDFEMKPSSRGGLAPKVIGATQADSRNWPATFVFRNPEGDSCTATAIGPRSILTAAHCIRNLAHGMVHIGNANIAATCTRHPAYQKVPQSDPDWQAKGSSDFALCATTGDLPIAQFETIGTCKLKPCRPPLMQRPALQRRIC